MENKNAVEANAQPAAVEEKAKLPPQEDYEARNKALEAEKARLIEEASNYKLAFFKEKNKNAENVEPGEEERLRGIAREEVANSRIMEIAREQDEIIRKALKENNELKLAQLNKPAIPVSVGSHSESQAVTDTSITPEQMQAFKSRGWSDKDIERYKKNLNKYGGR